MADRTPRILYRNRLLDAGAVLSASSQDLPVRGVFCLRDPTPTRVWRGRLGWNVVTLFNNKIYFNESGNNRVGTIALGNYASGSAAAAAVQTAMNTAPGVSNTYTVTYSAGFFTITRASGASTCTLQFASTNQDSIHQDLGYSNTNVSAVGGATGDNAAYKSREWLKVQWLAGVPITTGLVYAHNLGIEGSTTSVHLQLANTDSFENHAPAAGDLLAGDDEDRIYIADRASDTKSWARILIKDVSYNTLGYSEVGIAFIGDYLQPGRSIRQGWRQRQRQLTRYSMGDTGSVFVDLKPSPREFDITIPRVSLADRDAMVTFSNTVRLGGSFVYRFDPLNFPGKHTHYVYLTKEVTFDQRVGDGNPPDRFDVGEFSMMEHL